ncbi:hypothetical protein AAC387_Pa05g0862 [Persea americana]
MSPVTTNSPGVLLKSISTTQQESMTNQGSTNPILSSSSTPVSTEDLCRGRLLLSELYTTKKREPATLFRTMFNYISATEISFSDLSSPIQASQTVFLLSFRFQCQSEPTEFESSVHSDRGFLPQPSSIIGPQEIKDLSANRSAARTQSPDPLVSATDSTRSASLTLPSTATEHPEPAPCSDLLRCVPSALKDQQPSAF